MHDLAFVDASLFMGMNADTETVRIACKNFFASRLRWPLAMPLDQVGLCDDMVWRFPRQVQDAYYPFMDQLHTELAASRVPYTQEDIRRTQEDSRLQGLDGSRALMLARVCNDDAALYTIDAILLKRRGLPVYPVSPSTELAFPVGIEHAYRAALVLRVKSPPPQTNREESWRVA